MNDIYFLKCMNNRNIIRNEQNIWFILQNYCLYKTHSQLKISTSYMNDWNFYQRLIQLKINFFHIIKELHLIINKQT